MEGQRLATAEWMNPAVTVEKYEYESGTFFLGRSPLDGSLLGYKDDRHVCLVAGNRSGKGATAIVNNLCEWPGSVVVNDPKGENATITAARRGKGSEYCEGMGQAVHVLDPMRESSVDEEYRSRFNPLDALDPNNPRTVDDAGLLADALVPTSSDGGEDAAFFQLSARKMIKTLILHVLTDPDFEGRRNLLTVRDLIMSGDPEGGKIAKAAKAEKIPTAQEWLWTCVSQNMAFDGVVGRLGNSFFDVLNTAPKQFAGTRENAEQNTEFLDSAGMRECVSASDFKISDLKTDPKGMSLYFCVPARYMGEHHRWLRMMVTLVVAEMEATGGQPTCGHRVLLCLDEFAGLKKMQVMENAVAQLAGFGVKLFFILQTLVQLKQTYGEGWEVFLSNAGLKVFFSPDDPFTCEYVSKMLGDTEVLVETNTWSTTETKTTSTTETAGETITKGTNESTTNATNHNTTNSTNEYTNRGQNRSTSTGGNESTGENFSRSQGDNWGKNWSQSKGGGQAEGASWLGSPFLFRNTEKYCHFFREHENRNINENKHWSNSRGGSHGGQESTSAGYTKQTGKTWQKGMGDSFGSGSGTTHSEATGESTSKMTGSSNSVAKNKSTARATGESTGKTIGGSTTFQKRPLITVDEFRLFFDRIEDGGPGWSLVMVGGQRPIISSRSRYYEDAFFKCHYDPHPDHEPPQKLIGTEKIILPDTLHQRIINEGQLTWDVQPGQRVERGDKIAKVFVPVQHGDERIIFKRHYPNMEEGGIFLPLQTTLLGRVETIWRPSLREVMDNNGGEIATFTVNHRRLVEMGDTPIIQPLDTFSELLERLPGELKKLAEQRAAKAQKARLDAEKARLAAEEERQRQEEARKDEFMKAVWWIGDYDGRFVVSAILAFPIASLLMGAGLSGAIQKNSATGIPIDYFAVFLFFSLSLLGASVAINYFFGGNIESYLRSIRNKQWEKMGRIGKEAYEKERAQFWSHVNTKNSLRFLYIGLIAFYTLFAIGLSWSIKSIGFQNKAMFTISAVIVFFILVVALDSLQKLYNVCCWYWGQRGAGERHA